MGLSRKPLAVDSTTFESRHVSRHYERRCKKTAEAKTAGEAGRRPRAEEKAAGTGQKGANGANGKAGTKGKGGRSGTVKRLPKLGLAVAAASHLILGAWVGTGGGSDHPHFQPVVTAARDRVANRSFKVAADAGYDSEAHHEWCRGDMGLTSLIPPDIGRPRTDGGPPGGKWRAHMKRLMATKESRKRCGYTQRWQAETVNSMMKRNLGSALAGKSAWSRRRDMLLKVLTHNIMLL